jgi:hypothetical protein
VVELVIETNRGVRDWRGLCKSSLVPSKVIERTAMINEQTSNKKIFPCIDLYKVSLRRSAYQLTDKFLSLKPG